MQNSRLHLLREAEEFGLDFRFGGSAKSTCCGSLDLKATNRLRGWGGVELITMAKGIFLAGDKQ